MATDRDIRYTPGAIEIRSDHGANGSLGTITGYSAVFDIRSEDLGGFVEIVARGAFDKVISESPDVRGLVNHDGNLIIGRTSSGTMRLSIEQKGLRYEIDVADTQPGRDILTSIKRGDVSGSSFAFVVGEDRWDTVDGQEIRTIIEVKGLYDSGPVTQPAYPATVAAASKRSLEAYAFPKLLKYRSRVDADVAKYL